MERIKVRASWVIGHNPGTFLYPNFLDLPKLRFAPCQWQRRLIPAHSLHS